MHKAVLWDFGGVILSSPFEAFNRYEAAHGLPPDFLRSVNATNPHDNAWAKLERGEIDPDEFDQQFADEADALGHRVPGADILALLSGAIRPEMVDLLDRVKAAGYKVACLTNNVVGSESAAGRTPEHAAALAAVMARFDDVVESSKIGVRKPEPRFYEIACERLGVRPEDCVFLDDLGINLKPAAKMGMATIKVISAQQATDELVEVLGLRSDHVTRDVTVDDALNELDEQVGNRNRRLSLLGTFVVVGAMMLFGQRWLNRAVAAVVLEHRQRPSWPVELFYYVLYFDLGLMLIWLLLLPIVGHLRDRRLGSVRRGTLTSRIPRWLLRVVVGTATQYLAALIVFSSLRSGLGIAGAAIGIAAVTAVANLQGRRLWSLYAPMRPMPLGPLDDEISLLAGRTSAAPFRRYEVAEKAVGTRLNAGVSYNGTKPVMMVWDTAGDMPDDQRRMMLGHELGHMVHGDVPKLVALVSAIAGLATMIGVAMAPHVNLIHGLESSTLPTGDPRLYFSYRLVSIYATLPLGFATLKFRRSLERAADDFALDLERNPGAFRRLMVTLVRANRSPVSRAFGGAGCTHPPVRQRLQFASDWERRNAGAWPPPKVRESH